MTQPNLAVYARRRERFRSQLPPGAGAWIPASEPRVRSHDTEYRYRPDSDLYYLTGFTEPRAALAFTPDGKTIAFVQPKDPERETWDGRRLGVEAAPEALGVDEAYSIDALESVLAKRFLGVTALVTPFGVERLHDERVLALLPRLKSRTVQPPAQLVSAGSILHEMRLIKDAHELGLMRRAAAITAMGYAEAAPFMTPGRREYAVQAALEFAYRREGGNGSSYNAIVAGGENACILHYDTNEDPLRDGQLLLIDSGAEYGYYACDVTRTYPVGGRFSGPQRAIYELVLKAQEEAIACVRLGEHVKGYHQRAVRVLTEGMVDLGLLKGSVDDLIATEAYRKFYMHGTGHYLGLDVHDVGAYTRPGSTAWRPLEVGMVLTVEPGLYIPSGTPDVDPRFWGIGVRIEDDVHVGEDGPEVLTHAIPKAIDAVEALTAQAVARA